MNVIQVNSLNEIVDYEGSLHDGISAIEKEYPDMTIHIDKNLSSLVETLEDNGFTDEEIIQMNGAQYGDVVDFYKVHEEDIYLMLIGAR